MGSVGSRSKKIAPASGDGLQAYNDNDSAPSDMTESRSLNPLKIHKPGDSTLSRCNALPDSHSEGPGSEFSADDDIEVELDRVLAQYESQGSKGTKSPQKKSSVRSKTYGFYNSRHAYDETAFKSTPHLDSSEHTERTHPGNIGAVNASDKKEDFCQLWENALCFSDTFANGLKPIDLPALSSPHDHTGSRETASVPGTCDGTAVILYHGSEEDLMETIEKEFS